MWRPVPRPEFKYQASYSYITDDQFKPIGILHLPYYEENSFYDKELQEFLMRLGAVYLFMFLLAIALAYFISKYITKVPEDHYGKTQSDTPGPDQ